MEGIFEKFCLSTAPLGPASRPRCHTHAHACRHVKMKPRLLLPRSSTPQEEHAQHRARPGPAGGTAGRHRTRISVSTHTRLGLNFTEQGLHATLLFSCPPGRTTTAMAVVQHVRLSVYVNARSPREHPQLRGHFERGHLRRPSNTCPHLVTSSGGRHGTAVSAGSERRAPSIGFGTGG